MPKKVAIAPPPALEISVAASANILNPTPRAKAPAPTKAKAAPSFIYAPALLRILPGLVIFGVSISGALIFLALLKPLKNLETSFI